MHEISQKNSKGKLQIGLICGGPSLERGISLNSARSVLDHLGSETLEIVPFYLDTKRKAYRISRAQLYCNTPSDFDFKLKQTAKPLSERQFVQALKQTDIVFPVMHGAYGEDGGIQRFLEKHAIPFVGSGSDSCKRAFDKYSGNEHAKANGFFTLPSAILKIYEDDHEEILHRFFKDNHITRAVVKPATGGSSIGVSSVTSVEEALKAVQRLFGKRVDTRLVVEPFAKGKEFTVIILQNRYGIPVALPPTEMDMSYADNQIFDFRRKYLPTRHVTYHCPPRFGNASVERIQAHAEQLFSSFGMHDFARFDGWVLPDGNIWFCDFNTISGMEQNSFLFQQGARVGMSHRGILHYILESAARRHSLVLPEEESFVRRERRPVSVLFGGNTSERQVSLMSGTNVWLKLRRSKVYEPRPFLLDTKGRVWRLPYHLTLNHTVEEITENCENYEVTKKRFLEFEERARLHLGLRAQKNSREFFDPQKMTLEDFFKESEFVFNALHGGEGEDGTLQLQLAKHNILFNGPGARTSKLCMDKWATAEYIRRSNIEGVSATVGTIAATNMLLALKPDALEKFWKGIKRTLSARSLVVKPRSDGCSTGVVHLFSATDLHKYLELLRKKETHAKPGTFTHQAGLIEMPPVLPEHLIFEQFVETDALRVRSNTLKHIPKSGYVEVTVGVVKMNEKLYAFNPSITIAEGEVLSVEEKFQGGTGVNLTPPPSFVMKPSIVHKIRERAEHVAKKVGIEGYSRIDAFAHIRTGELLVIEVNTLPGLTPSTVLYHQALAESPPIFPRQLLETLIKNKRY
jgi:D-alanine--D-alanine ligase